MNTTRGKQLQLSQVRFLLFGVFLCTFYQLTICVQLNNLLPLAYIGEDFQKGYRLEIEETTADVEGLEEPLTATRGLESTDQKTQTLVGHYTDTTSDFKVSTNSESPLLPILKKIPVYSIYVPPQDSVETPTPAPAPSVTTSPAAFHDEAPHVNKRYPEDLFSIEDRRRGWVILHILGMMYTFVSLVIVCDEFFVPAVEVMMDKLAISDDVAGATFMASGRSIPRFFASLIGVFVSRNDVVFTQSVVSFGTTVGSGVFNILFVIGMCTLFSREVLHLNQWPVFRDVSFYIADLILAIIFFLDNFIMWWESMVLLVCYMLYVIFMKFNAQAEQTFKNQLHKLKSTVKILGEEECEKVDAPEREDNTGGPGDSEEDDGNKNSGYPSENEGNENKVEEEEAEQKGKLLSLQWPDTRCKQAIYLILLPIILPLRLTVPDIRNKKFRKFFVVTYLFSIVWISVFSYLVMWWAHQVGETFGTLHLTTLLAAAASNPDLITSVIVTRKGLGNMAVSSSVGSNIFNITLSLPVPWLLYSFIHGFAPVAVSNKGLFCAATLLFLMLFFAIISIISCKWKMTKILGFTMLLLYLLFVVISIMLHYGVLICPVG